jgi:hypothetical protein
MLPLPLLLVGRPRDPTFVASDRTNMNGTARAKLALSRELPSRDAFDAECAQRSALPPRILMVPKAGSRTLVKLGNCTRYQEERAKHRPRIHLHGVAYQPCTIASLREPCERAVSIFKHMYELYHGRAKREYCTYAATPVCTTHWFHRATHVDEFAALLRDNFEEVLAHNMNDLRSSKRHRVVVMPQYLWLGGLSHVVCTPRLDEELPALASRFGCVNGTKCACAEQFATALGARSEAVGSAHDVAVDWAGHRTQHKAAPAQLNLSQAGCAVIRDVYARDTELWQQLCARRTLPSR